LHFVGEVQKKNKKRDDRSEIWGVTKRGGV